MTRKSLPEEIMDALQDTQFFSHGVIGIDRALDSIKLAIDRHTKRNKPKKDPKLANLLRQYDAAKRRAWYHSKVPTKVEGKRAKYPSELSYKYAMIDCERCADNIEVLSGVRPRPFDPRA